MYEGATVVGLEYILGMVRNQKWKEFRMLLDPTKHRNGSFIPEFVRLKALWAHNGDPCAPHALLTAGGHSDGFHNWSATRDGDKAVARAAVKALTWQDSSLVTGVNDPDVVMGPQTGATYIAQRMAMELCRTWSSPRKDPLPDGTKRFVFDPTDEMHGRHPGIPDPLRVLVCEDTITTSASVAASIKACEEAGGEALPYVFCIVNRSTLTHVGRRRIISLLHIPMQTWDVKHGEECPLCKAGSEALPPKANWQRLVGGR